MLKCIISVKGCILARQVDERFCTFFFSLYFGFATTSLNVC